MRLHSALLVIQCTSTLLTNFPDSWQALQIDLWSIIPLVDLVVQLLICYICWTLGASEQLNKFDCYMIEDGRGGFLLKYVHRESVRSAIGEAYLATNQSDSEGSDENEENYTRNSFTNGSLW